MKAVTQRLARSARWVLAACLCATPSAWAQPAGGVDAEYRRGIEQFIARGRGQEALDHFQPLWERTREPRMLWQVAVSLNLLQRWLEAERAMREVLDRADDPWVQRQRGGPDGLEADLRQVRQHLGLVSVTCQPTCAAVTINGEPMLDVVTPVEPGTVRVAARREGAAPVMRAVAVDAGERLVVHIVFDTRPPRDPEAPPPVPSTPREAPVEAVAPPATPRDDEGARFWLDVGAGIGVAMVSGHPSYAERFDYVVGSTSGFTCGERSCPATVDGNLGTSEFLSLTGRYRASRRVAVGLGVRLQLGAAGWSTSATVVDRGVAVVVTRSNPMANLLVMGRIYVAPFGDGYTAEGWVPSVILGLGVGQIEPTLILGGNDTRPSSHVVSGFANVHTGMRVERVWRGGLHLGVEAVMQVMFPLALPDLDVSAVVGFHL